MAPRTELERMVLAGTALGGKPLVFEEGSAAGTMALYAST
jgi:hypothetical protein